jgi:hypothetical protein
MAFRLTPHAFVISSTPGAGAAEAVERVLNEGNQLIVKKWKGVFKPTEGYGETLQRATLQFDFAISVVTPDDEVKRDRPGEKDSVFAPRDNVIFELGLFSAALGAKHVLPLVVTINGRQPSLPSDLGGLTFFPVEIDKQAPLEPQVKDVCDRLKAHMLQHYKRPGLGLLPSSALAIGYFENFIKPVTESLQIRQAYIAGDAKERRPLGPDKWELAIYLPSDLAKATSEHWRDEADGLGLGHGQTDLPKGFQGRPYPFRTKQQEPSERLELFDMPTTLRSVYQAIRRLMPEERTAPVDYQLADERGLADFYRSTLALIESASLSGRVKFIDWADPHPDLTQRKRLTQPPSVDS